MNIDASLIALVSVVASAIVALSPIWSSLLEKGKWRREQAKGAIEHVQRTAANLLECISDVQGYTYEKAVTAAPRNTDAPILIRQNYIPTPEAPKEEVYKALMRKYYSWEVVISPYCKEPEQKTLNELRNTLHEAARSPGSLADTASSLANAVLTISNSAIKNLS